MKRVAVTGAAGHVGGAVVRALLPSGVDVRVLVHADRRAIEGLPVEVHEGDIRDPDVVARLVADRDLVIHLAAVISLEARDEALMRAINVDAVRVVTDACLAAGVRLVHTSSWWCARGGRISSISVGRKRARKAASHAISYDTYPRHE